MAAATRAARLGGALAPATGRIATLLQRRRGLRCCRFSEGAPRRKTARRATRRTGGPHTPTACATQILGRGTLPLPAAGG
eukprot:11553724-Alexandrium_andersonii.AAC.1